MSKPITPLAQLIGQRIVELEEYRLLSDRSEVQKTFEYAIKELTRVNIALKSCLDELAERTTAGGDVQFSQIVRVLDDNYE